MTLSRIDPNSHRNGRLRSKAKRLPSLLHSLLNSLLNRKFSHKMMIMTTLTSSNLNRIIAASSMPPCPRYHKSRKSSQLNHKSSQLNENHKFNESLRYPKWLNPNDRQFKLLNKHTSCQAKNLRSQIKTKCQKQQRKAYLRIHLRIQ